MKLTTGIVVLALTAGACWAQSSANNPNPKTTQPTANTPAAKAKPSAATVQTGPKAAVISISPVAMPAKAAAAPAKTATAKPAPAPAKAAIVPATATTTAKPAVVPAKVTPTAKPAVIPAKTTTAPAKPAVVPAKTTAVKSEVKVVPTKTAAPATKATSAPAKTPATAVSAKTSTKPATKIAAAPTSPAKDTNTASSEKETAKNEKAEDKKSEDKKYAMTGKRDPFISPVVNRSMGSGCSTGKKCLDIEQIALHGVVKSDNGMIAVVTNGLNKAYFLRENDPVFNGYVVKITVDSIVFKQTLQDRLGKSFTKDVVKRILTPAV
jgi:hypothetical protein